MASQALVLAVICFLGEMESKEFVCLSKAQSVKKAEMGKRRNGKEKEELRVPSIFL